MNTRSLFLFLSLATASAAHPQGQWTQALQSSSSQSEGAVASRICPDNGIVSIGYFRNEAVFGSTTLSGGFPDQKVCFMVKHSPTGSVEWAHSITNTDANDEVIGRGLAVDGQGNIILGGTGIDTILVDGVFATENSDQVNGEAMFIIKFAPNGNVLWSVDAESTALGSELMALTVDPSDNIWFCGPISAGASKAFKLEGATGIEMVETGVIPGRVRQIDTDANGNVYLRGQSNAAFTLNGQSCPANTVLGGTTTNWTGKFNTNAIAQWFHVPDQGQTGFSPWQQANQATAPDGRTYVEALNNMRINGDTIADGTDHRGLYLLDANGSPLWWTRLNRTGILEIQDMATDPSGNCWISAKASGVLDLLDTIVTHDGFIAFHIDVSGNTLRRVFGPMVELACSVDAAEELAVFSGEYLSDISFGSHALTSDQNNAFVARFDHSADVGLEDRSTPVTLTAFPNPASDHVRLVGLPFGSYTVDVMDMHGRILQTLSGFNAQHDVVDLSRLSAGQLVLRVSSNAVLSTVKIVYTH